MWVMSPSTKTETMKSVRYIAMLMMAALAVVGCSDDDNDNTQIALPLEGVYGTYTFGEEQVPVNSFQVTEQGWFMVKLSPLENVTTAGTYAVIGIHPDLLGREIDVQSKYQQYDYMFIYEDPTYYHASYRPLQSGTIDIDVNGNVFSIKADVVTFDGRHFFYENNNLIIE